MGATLIHRSKQLRPDGVTVDNEAGKGDHRHLGAEEAEAPFAFVSMEHTVRAFLADVARLTEE